MIIKIPGHVDQAAIVAGLTKRGLCLHFINGEAKAPLSPPAKQIDASKASAEIWLKGEA